MILIMKSFCTQHNIYALYQAEKTSLHSQFARVLL